LENTDRAFREITKGRGHNRAISPPRRTQCVHYYHF
jgi:hypothetical protein